MLLTELVLPLVLLVTMKIGENDGLCVVITNPVTTVVLLNELAKFMCAVDPQNSNVVYILLNGVDTSLSANKTEYELRGIFWESYENGNIQLFNITINGTAENNGFSVSCGFGVCSSDEARIIVVDGPPASPDPPLITIINSTTLLVFWSPPWSNPINNYILSCSSNNTTEINKTLASNETSTEFVLDKTFENNCEVYEFRVLAVTNVGTTEFSNITYRGFPKDFSTLEPTEGQQINITEQRCNDSSTITILGMIPLVCQYETITYMFLVTDLVTSNQINVTIIDKNTPKAFFWLLTTSNPLYYNITQISTNEAGQMMAFSNVIALPFPVITSTFDEFNTVISSTFNSVITSKFNSSTFNSVITSTFDESVSTVTSTSISLQSSVSLLLLDQPIIIGSIVSGCVAVIALSALVTIVLLIVIYRRKGKRSVHVTNFNFPNMTSNDIYVSTNDHDYVSTNDHGNVCTNDHGCVSTNDHGCVSTNDHGNVSTNHDLITNASSVGGTDEYIEMSILTHPTL